MYTYRFEEYVLRMLIGSNEEEVAARLGISAETVELIVENQLKDDKRIDPARVIKHVGMDEISPPRPVNGIRHEPRPHRIEFHVARARQPIGVVHHERSEPPLPEIAVVRERLGGLLKHYYRKAA